MPKRVLMTADTVGGVWTYALELAAALGRRGIEVALATMGLPLTSQQWLAAQSIANLEVFESNFKLEWMDDPWEDVGRAGLWLLELEARLQPDVVHLNGYVHGALPWIAPTLVVGHSCVLSWWEAVKGEPAPAAWDRYQQEVRRGLQAASLVVAPTSAMLAFLNKYYGGFVNSKVIVNGRDAAVFYPALKQEFIFTAGRLWDEAKNVSALAEIATEVSWRIYLAGEEKHPSEALQRHKEGVEGAPVLLGRLSTGELASWYASAAIYALPARYEPFGLSVLEAALSGCALVLGDIPSLREIWGEAGVFVPPDDKKALASAINTLINDASLRATFATRAFTRAQDFTVGRMVGGYLSAYQDLLG
jgi:glycosyltransferase involved in cell wall biosynthesis